MSRSIRLSEKHGLNPVLGVCSWCGKDDGSIGLPGLLPGDAEAPHRAVISREPCDNCKAGMALGVTFVEVEDGTESDPVRTGRWSVLRDEAVERIFEPATAAALVKSRIGHLERSAYEQLGLHEQDPWVQVLCQCGWGDLKIRTSDVPSECPVCSSPLKATQE